MTDRIWMGVFLVSIFVIGCSPKASVPAISPEVTPASVSPDALVRLEQADMLDGKADHVIGKCYVCNLGMDGSDKYTAKIGSFTAHLCSKSCQKEFESSAEKIVLETEMPKATHKE
jgi:hypothetical protein